MNNNVLNIFYQLINNGNNPQQIIQSMLMRNPQYQMIFNQISQSGLSTKDYVLQYARQNNINIQPMIELLNNKGFKL